MNVIDGTQISAAHWIAQTTHHSLQSATDLVAGFVRFQQMCESSAVSMRELRSALDDLAARRKPPITKRRGPRGRRISLRVLR